MQDIGMLNALGAKIRYLSQAQSIVSQNIANADTPGYRPKQLTPVDFSTLLGKTGNGGKVQLLATNSDHLNAGGAKAGKAKAHEQDMTYEVAPAENAVILEEQLVEANKIRMDYELAINLYGRNLSLLRTALGVNR